MSNSSMIPQLTPEQQQALDAADGIVQGDSFVLLRTDAVLRWFGFESPDNLRSVLRLAFEQADRGELQEWDVEKFLDRMHGRLEHRTA